MKTKLHLIIITLILSGCGLESSLFPDSSSSASLLSSDQTSSEFASSNLELSSSSSDSSMGSETSSSVIASSLNGSSSEVISSSEVTVTSSSILNSSINTTSLPSTPTFTFTIASNAPSYYQNINPNLTGESLKNALDLLISTNVNVSYDWSRFESADESMTETNKVLTIYPRRNYLKTAHVSGNTASTWNREHTYPQSKISGAAVDDNHHIFADDWKTNSTRGNFKFGMVSKSESTRVKDSSNLTTDNYVGGGFFEPNDAAKGEVARATLYMNTYYGYTLENNFQTAEMAILWAIQYPPTDRDMQRNNRVYTNQRNRNPYVDSAAYICGVYGQMSLATRQVCGLA